MLNCLCLITAVIIIIIIIIRLPLNALNVICDLKFPFENDSTFRITFAVCHMAGTFFLHVVTVSEYVYFLYV